MRHYPIWIQASSDAVKDKNIGARSLCTFDVAVGTSAKNSHHLCSVRLRRRAEVGVDTFTLDVDGEVLCRAVFDGHDLHPVQGFRSPVSISKEALKGYIEREVAELQDIPDKELELLLDAMLEGAQQGALEEMCTFIIARRDGRLDEYL